MAKINIEVHAPDMSMDELRAFLGCSELEQVSHLAQSMANKTSYWSVKVTNALDGALVCQEESGLYQYVMTKE